MKNALIAAIVSAVVAASGGFAAGMSTDSDYVQDTRLDLLEAKVQCLAKYDNHDRAQACIYYIQFGDR